MPVHCSLVALCMVFLPSPQALIPATTRPDTEKRHSHIYTTTTAVLHYRNSTIMQSLIDRANHGGYYMPQEQQTQHWEYQWHRPAREHLHAGPAASAAAAPAAAAAAADGENSTDTYPFQYKTWVPAPRKQDADTDTQETVLPLDLKQYSRSKYTSNNNGLTEADIRGAVGGTEAIPGLSASSDANTSATKAAQQAADATNAPVTETAETPAAVETAVVAEATSTTPAAEATTETPATTTEATADAAVTEATATETPATDAAATETPAAETTAAAPENEDIEMQD